jgi:ABC-type amino acid transport substrate-binding protein
MVVTKGLLFTIFLGLLYAENMPILHVTTVLMEPFVMNGSHKGFSYHGLLVDMLRFILEEREGFLHDANVQWNVLTDYGIKQPDGSWTGIINEIANKTRRSVGIADVTITSERLDVVQFSVPYFTTGMTAIGKVGFDITRETLPKILQMAEDGKITVGVQNDQLPGVFFRNTKDETFKKLYEIMKKDDSNFVQTYQDAINKVRAAPADKPYVFFGEKASIDYLAGKIPCDLKVTSCEPLTTLEYALVFNKDANPEFVNFFNKAITDFLASGKMQAAVHKWYKNGCQDGGAGNETLF